MRLVAATALLLALIAAPATAAPVEAGGQGHGRLAAPPLPQPEPVRGTPGPPAAAPIEAGAKRNCVYAAHYISKLNAFGDIVGHSYDCALVYNDAAPAWPDWENPWFVRHVDPDLNWAKWKAAAPGRTLIIT